MPLGQMLLQNPEPSFSQPIKDRDAESITNLSLKRAGFREGARFQKHSNIQDALLIEMMQIRNSGKGEVCRVRKSEIHQRGGVEKRCKSEINPLLKSYYIVIQVLLTLRNIIGAQNTWTEMHSCVTNDLRRKHIFA